MIFKRFVICFTVSFLIFRLFIPIYNVKASTVDNFGLDMLDYLTLESLSVAVTEGAEISWEDLDLGDALISNEEKARKMLSYYRQKAFGYTAAGILGIEDMFSDISVSEAQTAAISFQLGSGVSSSNINSLYNQISNNALGLSNNDYIMTMNDYNVAFWNQFNKQYLNTYLSNVNAIDPNIVFPDLPINYSWLDNLNTCLVNDGSGNYFDINETIRTIDQYDNNITTAKYIKDTTIFTPNNISHNGAWKRAVRFYNLASVNVVNNNGIYELIFSELTPIVMFPALGGSIYSIWGSGNKVLASSSDQSSGWNISTQFNDLDSALTYIHTHFTNIDLYVEGSLWISYNDISSNSFNVSIPNAVIDSSNEDGKIVAAPIYWAVDENTGNPIDEFQINLNRVLDLIETKINNGQTSIKAQDLVDAGAYEKDGIAIGIGSGVSIGVRSLSDVIDDAIDIPTTIEDSITLEDSLAEDVPGLPALPPMGNNPGFNGVSVLAEIVNFTNQSLPNELILVFWGVVFGAIVLGLIKILHK